MFELHRCDVNVSAHELTKYGGKQEFCMRQWKENVFHKQKAKLPHEHKLSFFSSRPTILQIGTLCIPEDNANAALAHVFQTSNELQTAVKAGTQFIYGNIIFSVCGGGWAGVKQCFSNFFSYKDPQFGMHYTPIQTGK